MLQEIIDLRAEGDALYELLHTLDDTTWQRRTQFQDWTVHDVVMHLHFSDHMALTTASDKAAFEALLTEIMMAMGQGIRLMPFTRQWMGEIDGIALLQRWRDTFLQMCDTLGALDPKARLDWFGPDMGVRMFATARLMETWAHAQEIYDLLGLVRTNTERIKHVVVMGVKTFAWTFINRSMAPLSPMPYLALEAPSGELWTWGEPDPDNTITGKAEEFAQVVTQVRNIKDTDLNCQGDIATQWMAIAQCFAGPPVDPPPPGTRFRQTT